MDFLSNSNGEQESGLSETIESDTQNYDVARTVFHQDIDSLLSEEVVDNEYIQGNYIFYGLNCDKVMLALIKPCSLYFYGSVSVECIAGHVEILGYELDSKKPAVEVYSCEGSSALYVSTIDNVKEDNPVDISIVSNLGFSFMEATKICNWVGKGGCILLLNYPEKKQHIRQRSGRAEKRLGLSVDTSRKRIKNKVNIPPEIHLDIKEGITVLCGGQGVGKSTSLRYLTNRALNHSKHVLFVDLDIGQPEFTLHECVTATIVDTPIIGPSYTHYRKPYRSYNVGNIDASRCVDTYIRAVELLIEECRSSFSDIPWLVNTMGFSKGVGVYITCTCLAIIKPSSVIQIDGDQSKNFPSDLTKNFVTSISKRPLPMYQLNKVTSQFRTIKDPSFSFAYTNKQVRWIATENYFSDCLRPSYPLVVPIDFLKVFNVIDKTVIPIDQYNHLIGKLVIISNSDNLDEPPQVLDYGVIVAYVETEKVFLILTPLEPGINVMNIESILVGSLQIPDKLNKSVSPSTKGLIPYCQIRQMGKSAPTVKPLKRTYRFLFEPTFSVSRGNSEH